MLEISLAVGILCLLGVTVTYGLSLSGAGLSIQPQPITRSSSGPIGLEDTVPVAQAGSLTTRTDDNTGTITMGSGSHTITTSAVVDVYWSGGVRYGVTVGTVSGTSVPIDLGSGDNLPAQDTAVTVVVQKSINLAIDGDNVKIIGIELSTNDKSLRTAGHVQFVDAGAAEIHEVDLVTNVPQIWDIEGGANNPFTGNPITALKASQASTSSTETWTLKVVGVQDASP